MGDAPGRNRTYDARFSLPLWLSPPTTAVCGLDYIFTVTGAMRIVSTEPLPLLRQWGGQLYQAQVCRAPFRLPHEFPRYCHFTGFTDTAPFILRVLFPRKRSSP
jgi:hypothetical protein